MDKQFVNLIAAGATLVAVASVALLAYAIDPAAGAVDAVIEPRLRTLDPTRQRQVAEETVEPSILVLPTITIVGEPPRRRAAELPRPDARPALDQMVALP
jgi:hypothetical protein